jgi:hypothetical protein
LIAVPDEGKRTLGLIVGAAAAWNPLLFLRSQQAGWMGFSARLPNVKFAFFSRLGATSGAANAQSCVLRGFHDRMMQDFVGPS